MLDHFYGICVVDHHNQKVFIGDSEKVASFITEKTDGYVYGRISKSDPDMFIKLKEMGEKASDENGYKAFLCP